MEIYSIVSGKVVCLEDVSDPVFSEKMAGDGVGIIPDSSIICSPVDGVVSMLFPTKHAIGIHCQDNTDILIHIGIDTVELEGNGFQLHVTDGELVKKGQKLMTVDLKLLKEKGYNSVTSIFVTNSKEMKEVVPVAKDKIKAGDPLIRVESNVN